MATYTAYANFVAYFSDLAEFEFARGIVPEDTSLRINPVDAAALFDIEFPGPGGPIGTKGFIFNYPNLPNTNINHPAPSGVLLDPSVDFVTVPGQATSISPTPGADMILYWSMSVVYRGPEYDGGDPLLIAAIPPRRWAWGAEAFANADFRPQAGSGNRARDASRVVDGFGIKVRSQSGSSTAQVNLSNSEGTGLPTKKSWERFYLRIRNFGSVAYTAVWEATGSLSTLSGARVTLNTDGTLTAFNVNGIGVNDATFGTSSPLELDTWYKVDILVTFATGVLNGTFRLYLNGFEEINGFQGTGSTGLGQNQNHRQTDILGTGTANTWELDFDDWHNAEIPNIAGVEVLNSVDWMSGTHSKSSLIASGTNVNWTGILQAMNQFLNPTGSALTMIATAALATIRGLTNIVDFDSTNQDTTGVVLGAAAVSFNVYGSQAGGAPNNGRLGYSIAGGADVFNTAFTLPGTTFAIVFSYFPSGSLTPYPVEPVEIIYEKGPIVSNATVAALEATVQYIGLWGPEDTNIGSPIVFENLNLTILHNCRYNQLWWSRNGPPMDAPVCVVGGTYVGNGTFQIINLVLPCHILVIRNTATGTPVVVNTTMITPESGGAGVGVAGDIPILYADASGQAFFVVTGDGARVNQNAVTYQYFAFCDPGVRYMLNDEFNHGSSALIWNNPLIDSGFLPEYGIFMATPAAPGGIWFKGPRHTGLEVSTGAGVIVNNAVEFQLGNLSTGDGISETNNATAFSLFRTSDGSALTMVQVTSYTGNGLASRVIPLTPVCSRFPLVVFVTRRGGSQGTVYRDPSHAGVNSVVFGGSNITTGITAGGVDQITVGILLNANGGEYDVMCIPGSGSGWLNGTFCGPNGAVPGDFWDPDPTPLPPGVAILTEGGLTLGAVNPLTLLQDVSGIYTLIPGQHHDTLYDRMASQPSVDMEIPDPTWKTGYIGG